MTLSRVYIIKVLIAFDGRSFNRSVVQTIDKIGRQNVSEESLGGDKHRFSLDLSTLLIVILAV